MYFDSVNFAVWYCFLLMTFLYFEIDILYEHFDTIGGIFRLLKSTRNWDRCISPLIVLYPSFQALVYLNFPLAFVSNGDNLEEAWTLYYEYELIVNFGSFWIAMQGPVLCLLYKFYKKNIFKKLKKLILYIHNNFYLNWIYNYKSNTTFSFTSKHLFIF